MKLRKIGVIWAQAGSIPLTSNKDRTLYDSLLEAVAAVEKGLTDPDKANFQPWLRAGTGRGSAILDLHGIRILLAALEEGEAVGNGTLQPDATLHLLARPANARRLGDAFRELNLGGGTEHPLDDA